MRRHKDCAEIFWAITGECGLYIGTWLTRIEAIMAHSDDLSKSWRKCYRDGDRAIKVKITPVVKVRKRK